MDSTDCVSSRLGEPDIIVFVDVDSNWVSPRREVPFGKGVVGYVETGDCIRRIFCEENLSVINS